MNVKERLSAFGFRLSGNHGRSMRMRRCAPSPRADSRRPTAPAAFSLIEVLLAIVILGIGVISIAALFPAGIAQQRLSTDDYMGAMVAGHAMSVIRSKVSSQDFGTFEEFVDFEASSPPGIGDITRTIRGDWGWMRPSFLLDGNYPGAIDIFSYAQTVGGTGLPSEADIASEYHDGYPFDTLVDLYGIPYNTARWPIITSTTTAPNPPPVFITQQERYYPIQSTLVQTEIDPPRPQYVWDCMFRRYQGRIYVAIFVYRVSSNGGAGAMNYQVPQTNGTIPPLPIAIDLVDPGSDWPAYLVPWDIEYQNDRPVAETDGFLFSEFNVLQENQGWQAQRQWILDQNNNIHRVLANRREGPDMVIELAKPLTPVRLPNRPGGSTDPYENAVNTEGPTWPTYGADEYYGDPPGVGPQDPNMVFPNFDRGVVTRFWYIPLRIEVESGIEYSLTPIYIGVKEL